MPFNWYQYPCFFNVYIYNLLWQPFLLFVHVADHVLSVHVHKLNGDCLIEVIYMYKTLAGNHGRTRRQVDIRHKKDRILYHRMGLITNTVFDL